MRPFRACALGQLEGLRGNVFKALGVVALGKNFQQFFVNGHARRVAAQSFFQNFFGLQVASVSQVNIRFGHGVDIISRVELAVRIHQRGAIGGAVMGVHTLPATGTKERLWFHVAFQE